MDCEQLLTEFLKEYPKYEESIRHQDGVPFVGWTGLRTFLVWLQRHNYICDAVLAGSNR
jgi:hypothetical protein